jgi:putative hemolysin
MKPNSTLYAHGSPLFEVRLAGSDVDVQAAQRLRYQVFVKEMGATGALVDHVLQLERDRFDTHAQHMLLLDKARAAEDQVVGVYRIMTEDMAATAGQFCCEDEYDLTVLRESGLRLLELGRSCLHQDYRGGPGILHLWAALSDYITTHAIDVLFGVASFQGTDLAANKQSLSMLHHRYLVPEKLRVTAKGPIVQPLDILPEDQIDRVAAVLEMPALIKGYLRLGGTVGEGVFVDHAFNTTDICMILQKDAIGALHKAIYAKGGARG